MALRNVAMVIADISGYTEFIRYNNATLEHAAGVIGQLLELMADRASHPLRLNKLEGDAAFMYADIQNDEAAGMQDVFRQVQALFVPFREKIEAIASDRESCPCYACQSVRNLQLKVVIHAGLVDVRIIRGFEELTGGDVILLHRLLKNSIPEREYVAVTGAAHRLCVDIGKPGGTVHEEQYGDVGTIALRIFIPGTERLESAPA